MTAFGAFRKVVEVHQPGEDQRVEPGELAAAVAGTVVVVVDVGVDRSRSPRRGCVVGSGSGSRENHASEHQRPDGRRPPLAERPAQNCDLIR
jgi:hypothetical protein